MAREGVRGRGFVTNLMGALARIKLLSHLGPEILPTKQSPGPVSSELNNGTETLKQRGDKGVPYTL